MRLNIMATVKTTSNQPLTTSMAGDIASSVRTRPLHRTRKTLKQANSPRKAAGRQTIDRHATTEVQAQC